VLANDSPDTIEYLEKYAQSQHQLQVPLLVLCSTISRYRSHAASDDRFDFASKPCGPLKLAKALRVCLERIERNCAYPSPQDSSVFTRNAQGVTAPQPQVLQSRSNSDDKTSLPISPPISPFADQSGAKFKPNVLIVEDNPINLMLLATFLKKKKYPFTKAENGLIGVQAVQMQPDNFDIILMDLQMPVMSGLEAIRAIRQLEADDPSMKRSHIIALTGLAGHDDIEEAYGAGVDLFLTKPVTFKTVNEELERWKAQIALVRDANLGVYSVV